MENCVVLKFGGASVSTPQAFHFISNIIADRKSKYKKVITVVSAMGDDTDQLIELAKQVNPTPPRRELDMLISTGERKSIALLAMALSLKNVDAISFTGSQAGVITSNDHFDAKICDIRPKRILEELEKGKVVIVAGFQGMSTAGEITTLGRGGSDTTAVALAIALGAEKVEFFKDVPGVFDQDPKKNPQAKLLPHLNYEEAYSIMVKGAQVLHARCIQLAEKNKIQLHVLPFSDFANDKLGTLIQNTNEKLEHAPSKQYEL